MEDNLVHMWRFGYFSFKCCIWDHWKKPERKRKNLIRLGIKHNQAYAWSRTRMGGWAVAQNLILGTTITLNRLKKPGYISLLEIYKQISPHLCAETLRCVGTT